MYVFSILFHHNVKILFLFEIHYKAKYNFTESLQNSSCFGKILIATGMANLVSLTDIAQEEEYWAYN